MSAQRVIMAIPKNDPPTAKSPLISNVYSDHFAISCLVLTHQSYKNIISKMCVKEPEKRTNIQTLLQHMSILSVTSNPLGEVIRSLFENSSSASPVCYLLNLNQMRFLISLDSAVFGKFNPNF
jgi:hypothetical protein